MYFYVFCRTVVRIILSFIYRPRITNAQLVPEEGPVVLCSNHRSSLDPPLVACYIRRRVRFMAKAELFAIPGFSWLIATLGAFPVTRGGMSMETMKTAIKVLKEGNVLVVFPEGSRSRDGKLGEGKKGAASLALRSGAKVVPIAIIGNYKPFRRLHIAYGQPIDAVNSVADLPASERAEALTAQIMAEIRKLLEQHS